MTSAPPRRVGLTGGIGSGKSTVAAFLAECGAYIIDADVIAREVVAVGTPGLAAVATAFPGVLAADGSLDRPALADRVFKDEVARRRLEGITHPLIRAEAERQMAAVPAGKVCVNDVPLLVERGLQQAYDLVVVVEAPMPLRLARLAERGMPESQARERIVSQATDEQRRAVADVLLDNSGDVDDLRRQIQDAWPRIAGLN